MLCKPLIIVHGRVAELRSFKPYTGVQKQNALD